MFFHFLRKETFSKKKFTTILYLSHKNVFNFKLINYIELHIYKYLVVDVKHIDDFHTHV